MDSAAREPFHRSSQIWKRFQRFCFSFFGILYWQFSVAIHRTALLLKQQALLWKFLLHVETVLLLLVTYLKQIFYVFPRVLFFLFPFFNASSTWNSPIVHNIVYTSLSCQTVWVPSMSFPLEACLTTFYSCPYLPIDWLIDWLIY